MKETVTIHKNELIQLIDHFWNKYLLQCVEKFLQQVIETPSKCILLVSGGFIFLPSLIDRIKDLFIKKYRSVEYICGVDPNLSPVAGAISLANSRKASQSDPILFSETTQTFTFNNIPLNKLKEINEYYIKSTENRRKKDSIINNITSQSNSILILINKSNSFCFKKKTKLKE